MYGGRRREKLDSKTYELYCFSVRLAAQGHIRIMGLAAPWVAASPSSKGTKPHMGSTATTNYVQRLQHEWGLININCEGELKSRLASDTLLIALTLVDQRHYRLYSLHSSILNLYISYS